MVLSELSDVGTSGTSNENENVCGCGENMLRTETCLYGSLSLMKAVTSSQAIRVGKQSLPSLDHPMSKPPSSNWTRIVADKLF